MKRKKIMNKSERLREAYRTLRMNIQYSLLNQQHKTLLFVSPEYNEKTISIMSHLAFMFSQIGKRVLLIEGDLHRPRLHRTYHVSKEPGLSEVLRHEMTLEEAIHQIQPNIHVLTSGVLTSNPSLLLKSKQMQQLIKVINPYYDVILIDSPPMTITSDALHLSNLVEGVILLIQQDYSSKQNVKHCQRQLQQIKAPLLGTILTHATEKTSRYHEYRQYLTR